MAKRAKTASEATRVRDHIINLIKEDALPQGRLPAERDLAKELAVGRGTARRVLAELEAEGRIHRHVGRGTFVTKGEQIGGEHDSLRAQSQVANAKGSNWSDARTSVAALKTPAFGDLDPANGRSPAEYIEARLRFEPELAWLIVAHATAGDFAAIWAHIERSRTADTMEQFEEIDADFHAALAQATHNNLVTDMYASIDQVRRCQHTKWSQLHGVAQTKEVRTTFIAEHEQIFAKLTQRDAAGARDVWRAHLLNTRRRIMDF